MTCSLWSRTPCFGHLLNGGLRAYWCSTRTLPRSYLQAGNAERKALITSQDVQGSLLVDYPETVHSVHTPFLRHLARMKKELTTLLSCATRSVTLTSAKKCTLMSCCQAARPIPRDYADPVCTGVVHSSDRLIMSQPEGHVTTGSLTIEHVEEFFTSQVGAVDQFDWFKGHNVGFITSSVASGAETLLFAACASTGPWSTRDTSPEFPCKPGCSTEVDDFTGVHTTFELFGFAH